MSEKTGFFNLDKTINPREKKNSKSKFASFCMKFDYI